ncbi:MAG: response regulator [Defluviitaleaceae bacterium]|nr:response regulator [Defluviitaleaceae bacterium]
MRKARTVIIVEDDERECKRLTEHAAGRKDINILEVTNSARRAAEVAHNMLPDAMIIDIELGKGMGSGIDLLKALENMDDDQRPVIVITTNNPSPILHDLTRNLKSDILYYKKQIGYSAKSVFDMIIMLCGVRGEAEDDTGEYITDQHKTESEPSANTRVLISKELNKIGITENSAGHKYFVEAILYIMKGKATVSQGIKDSSLSHCARHFEVSYSTVLRGMNAAIKKSWDIYDPKELAVHYTALLDRYTKRPTPLEMVYHYAKKLRETQEK